MTLAGSKNEFRSRLLGPSLMVCTVLVTAAAMSAQVEVSTGTGGNGIQMNNGGTGVSAASGQVSVWASSSTGRGMITNHNFDTADRVIATWPCLSTQLVGGIVFGQSGSLGYQKEGCLDGNMFGIGVFTENSSGVPSWTTSLSPTSVLSTQLSTPAAPTATPTCGGGCSATWGYKIVAVDGAGGLSIASTEGSTGATQNATLDSTHKNVVTWSALGGAASYKVFRSTKATSPSTLGYIGTVNTGSPLTFTDDGSVAGDTSAAPTVNQTGKISSALGAMPYVLSAQIGSSDTVNCPNNTETDFATTYTLPANFLTANKLVRITFLGRLTSSGGPPTMAFSLKIGGTQVYLANKNGPTINLITIPIGATFYVQGTAAVGASVNVYTSLVSTGTLAAPFKQSDTSAATGTNTNQPIALATNSALTIAAGLYCFVNTAGNSLTLDQLIVESMN